MPLEWKERFKDDFEDADVTDWTQTQDGGNVFDCYLLDTNYVLRLVDTSTTDIIKVSHEIPKMASGKWSVEWKARIDDVRTMLAIIGRGVTYPLSDKIDVGIRTDLSTTKYYFVDFTVSPTVTRNTGVDIITGQLVHFKVEFDMDAGKLDVYINGVKCIADYSFNKDEFIGTDTDPQSVTFQATAGNETGTLYVDDVTVLELVEVPPPPPIQTLLNAVMSILPLVIFAPIFSVVLRMAKRLRR